MRPLLLLAFLASGSVAAQPIPDDGFSGDGFATFDVREFSTSGVALAPDGGLLVAGTLITSESEKLAGFVSRLGVDGRPDSTFGERGLAVIAEVPLQPGELLESMFLQAVDVLPDGRVVVSGVASFDSGPSATFVAMLSAEGAPEPSFGSNGVARLTGAGAVTRVLSTPDGIVVSRYVGTPGTLVRVRYDGSVDPLFGSPTLPNARIILDLAIRPDGRLVALGTAEPAAPAPGDVSDIGLWALNADGTLDPTFSEDGVLTEDLFGQTDVGLGLTLLPDGGLIASGYARKQAGNGLVLYRVDPAGVPVASFGFEGWTWTDVLSVNESPGRPFVSGGGGFGVLVGGNTVPEATVGLRVVGVTATGAPDIRYGPGGIATRFEDEGDLVFSGSVSAGGVIAGVGSVQFVGSSRPFAARLLNTLPTAGETTPVAAGALTITPNPSAGDARIALTLDAPTTATVRVVDALGRTVATLADGALGAGTHAFATGGLATGVYAVVAEAGDARSVTRLTVIR